MDSEIKILLNNGYISRKQYRDLLTLRWENLDQLKEHLLKERFLELPDWKDAEKLLGSPVKASDDTAPDSVNPAMTAQYETAMRVAATDTTVLILGESGVGKSRLAKLIHENSHRKNGPLVTVSCGSIPETLLESELFGVEKGAYTGAIRSREGRFQKASGGTIFLDEIGELTPPLQVKLLRVIQEKKIEPLGSGLELDVDIRLIAATNRNLEEETLQGRFREDLYFRLNVLPLTMLPLRDRGEDIPNLARYFLRQFQKRDGIQFTMDDDPAILEILMSYEWPGNIRELENCLERMTVLSRNGRLKAEDFPPRILRDTNYRPGERNSERLPASQLQMMMTGLPDDGNFLTLKQMEQTHIRNAMELSQGNIYQAAALLQIHRNTLARKLEDMNIKPTSFRKKGQKKLSASVNMS